MSSFSDLLFWCPDLLPSNFPGLPKHVYVDNGDKGVTYIAQLDTETDSIYHQMRRYNPEDRYPKINRRRPLWGDGFDPKENDKHDKPTTIQKARFPDNTEVKGHANQDQPNNDKSNGGCHGQIKKEGQYRSSPDSRAILASRDRQIQQQKPCVKPFRGDAFDDDVVKRNPKYRSRLCINYTKGRCRYGDKCTFIHNALTKRPFKSFKTPDSRSENSDENQHELILDSSIIA